MSQYQLSENCWTDRGYVSDLIWYWLYTKLAVTIIEPYTIVSSKTTMIAILSMVSVHQFSFVQDITHQINQPDFAQNNVQYEKFVTVLHELQ